jgi:DNA-binding transcriptional LysR family regulator
MNTFQLSCFLSVANHLSFAKAAQEMNISQPAITHQIKSLEEELNVRLFHRSTRVVELTLEGQAFLSDAKSMVSIAQRAKLRFQNPEERPITLFSLGGSSAHHLACLAPSLQTFSASIENLHPRLVTAPQDQLLHMLENDSLDVVFGIRMETPSRSQLSYREVCTCPLVCAVLPASPLAEETVISMEQLRQERLILWDALGLCPKAAEVQLKLAEGRDPSDLHFTSSADAAVVLAQSGFGIALLPEVLVEQADGLVIRPLSEEAEISLGLFYQEHPGDQLARQFAAIAKRQFNEK